MFKRIARRFVSFVLVIVLVLSVIPAVAYAASVNTGVTGLTADSSGSATWTSGNGTVTGSVSASSSSGCTGTTYTSQNGTLTFTNSSGAVGLLSFDFSITLSNGSVTIDGTDITASGSFSKTLNAGGTVAVRIASNETNTTATTISISNIKLTPETDVNVTFKAPEHGTYTVNGDEISAETTRTFKTTDSVVLSAAPANGYKFLGWYNVSSSEYFDLDAATSKSFTEETTVEPHFVVNTLPVFQVGTKVFTDLNEAVSYSQSSGINTIVLISDGVLSSGTYTIPGGKTLLIPFDDAQTLITNTNVGTLYEPYNAAYQYHSNEFRRLTLSGGSNLIIQGKLSVASKVYCMSIGQSGAYGLIQLENGSNITITNNADLYAFGYIRGSGTVTVESGAKVYESLFVADYPGSASNLLALKNAEVFPFSNFTVRNVEAPMTLNGNAVENVYFNMYGTSAGYHDAWIPLIGGINSDALFRTSGSVTKSYESNRQCIKIDGTSTIN